MWLFTILNGVARSTGYQALEEFISSLKISTQTEPEVVPGSWCLRVSRLHKSSPLSRWVARKSTSQTTVSPLILNHAVAASPLLVRRILWLRKSTSQTSWASYVFNGPAREPAILMLKSHLFQMSSQRWNTQWSCATGSEEFISSGSAKQSSGGKSKRMGGTTSKASAPPKSGSWASSSCDYSKCIQGWTRLAESAMVCRAARMSVNTASKWHRRKAQGWASHGDLPFRSKRHEPAIKLPSDLVYR